MKESFIDVWSDNLLCEADDEAILLSLLSTEEKTRAQAYSRDSLRQKYIKTRALLRKILADYLAVSPDEIKLATAQYGKPYLPDHVLYFNLSHTQNRFVVAVSNIEQIGIDMECVQSRKNISGLVGKCFSGVEKKYWQSLPESQQASLFFRFWVRKEAFVKAVGRGIALGLENCVIDPQNQNSFLAVPGQFGPAVDWKILEVPLADKEVCAVVLKNKACLPIEFKQLHRK